jgi:hypothetical protein
MNKDNAIKALIKLLWFFQILFTASQSLPADRCPETHRSMPPMLIIMISRSDKKEDPTEKD